MNRFNWGVLGVSGHFRSRILVPLSTSPTDRILAIASRNGDRARRAAEEMGIPLSFGSYEELLKNPEVEGVYIPLPNSSHLEWIEKAAAAGKHVLCEKPLTLSAADTAGAFETARKKGVRLMEAFMFPFHPQWIRIREILRSGEIGSPVSLEIRFAFDNRDENNIRNKPELGGGALRDIGCYGIAVTRFITGGRPEKLLSLIRRDSRFGTDILTSALMDYGDFHGSFTVSTQCWAGQSVVLSGTKGNIFVDIPFNMFPDMPARLRVVTGMGERIVSTGAADQYGLEFQGFSRAVRENDDAFFEEKRRFSEDIQMIMDGLFRSEETGTWEELP